MGGDRGRRLQESGELVAARDSLEKEVREKLNIPFNSSAASINYEHSMGQMGPLPANILRASLPEQTQRKAA